MKLKLLSLFFFVCFSCNSPHDEEPVKVQNEKAISEALIGVNQLMVKRNYQHIKNFVKRTGWEARETDRGIWMEILEDQPGEKISDGTNVRFVYSLRLIDGSEPYGISTLIPKTIVAGNSSLEPGLAYGLSFLSQGDSARMIIPPYLAFGNFGDSDKIPPDAILIYNVKILKVWGKD